MNRRSLHDLRFAELEQALVADGVNPHHARALWRALFREGRLDLPGEETFSPPLQRWLERSLGEDGGWRLDEPEQVELIRSADGLTRKFLLKLEDGQVIETVLMGYDHRMTACISSQAGCAMGCVFCATGQMGFVRHLRVGEIVSQVLHVQRHLRREMPERRLRNLVFMGMGEPLHNYESVMAALETITDVRGIGIGPSYISVSTVGVIPGILRMAEERVPYQLAVSLHGSTQEERSGLIPVAKRWSLESLVEACRQYQSITGKRIFFGWTLIEGVNDSVATAERLVELLRGIDGHVNLIPLNPTFGYGGKTTASASALAFKRVIQAAGFPCTFRQRRGIDVAAGCGQLKAEKLRAKVPAGQSGPAGGE